jgi:secondary thiamine-phosphate synthase enzyme
LRRSEAGRQHGQAEKTRSELSRAVFIKSVTGWRGGVKLSSTRMKFHTEHLTFNTKQHRQYINITGEVDAALHKSGIREGMILVSAMHITAGVWVNDAEDGLLADIDEWVEKLAPYRDNYRHHRTGETNGDSHLKSLLVHHQVIVPVTAGKLDFGPWQQVYYAEFDGQRPKRVIIKVMGE